MQVRGWIVRNFTKREIPEIGERFGMILDGFPKNLTRGFDPVERRER